VALDNVQSPRRRSRLDGGAGLTYAPDDMTINLPVMTQLGKGQGQDDPQLCFRHLKCQAAWCMDDT